MTELAVYESAPLPAIPARVGVPGTQDFDSWVAIASDVIKLAGHICDTPFVPDGMRGSAPAVAAAILAGREMGLGPMTSLANLDVIKGKPSQKPVLMRAMILSRGHKWVDVDVSDVRVVIKGCRKGESEWTEVTFTQAHAKLAGIDLGKYPADKLYARATSRLARRKFADVIMGMPYSDDELEDGVTDAGEVAEGSAAAIEEAKPVQRTARRRQPAPADGDLAAAPAAAPPAPAPAATPDSGLPPLPGEDDDPFAEPQPGTGSPPSLSAAEVDKDAPGTATVGKHGQLTAFWACMQADFGFRPAEKDQSRAIIETIIGRQLAGGSSGDLSFNEARTVLDTLANWKAVAEANGEPPREVMIAALAARQGDADAPF